MNDQSPDSAEILGRSFLRGEVSRDELLDVTRDFETSRYLFTEYMGEWDSDVLLVDGDLEVDGPLHLYRRNLAGLVVTGSLVVRGSYHDDYDPESGTFVLGDMRVDDNVVTGGWLNVGGSLRVRGGLVGDYNDCSASIVGQTQASFLYTEEHWFTFGGDVQVDMVLGRPRGEWPASTHLLSIPPSTYPDVLAPEAIAIESYEEEKPFDRATLTDEEIQDLDDILYLQHKIIVQRILDGTPIFI